MARRVKTWIGLAVLLVVVILAGFGIGWLWRSARNETWSKFGVRTLDAERKWVCPTGYKDTGRQWGDGKPNDWRQCRLNTNTKFASNMRYDTRTKQWVVGKCPGGYHYNGDPGQFPFVRGDRACVRDDDTNANSVTSLTMTPTVGMTMTPGTMGPRVSEATAVELGMLGEIPDDGTDDDTDDDDDY